MSKIWRRKDGENGLTGNGNNKKDFSERKANLTPLEYRVTQDRETERPYSNKYNRFFESGTYHCIVCDAELFKSSTKFESKSGWPAFYNVVDPKRVKLTADLSHIGANLLLLISKPDLARTEVSCANCNAHLGHLFKDGPKPTGLRYCINSSSLNFVPVNGEGEEEEIEALERQLDCLDGENGGIQEFPCNPENTCSLGGGGKSPNLKAQTLPPMASLCLRSPKDARKSSGGRNCSSIEAINTSSTSEVVRNINQANMNENGAKPDRARERSLSPPTQFPVFEKCTAYNKNKRQDDTPPERKLSNDASSNLNSSRFGPGRSSGRFGPSSSKGASLTAARISFFQNLQNQNQPAESRFSNRFVSSPSSGSLGLRSPKDSSPELDNNNSEKSKRRGSGPVPFQQISSPPTPVKETFL